MSLVFEVRFASSRLPSPQEWQKAIRSNGFDVEIDCDFDPVTFTGFLPARYEGQPAGFEYYYDDEAGRQSLVSLIWHSSAREAISGIIAGACLCALTEGELTDTEAGETIQASAVIARARQFEAEFQLLIAEEIAEGTRAAAAPVRPWWKLW